MRAQDYFNSKTRTRDLGREIEIPHHDCYACNDTGFVRPHDFFFGDLLKEIQEARIGLACTCYKGAGVLESGGVRFDEVNQETVRQVHENCRQDWQEYARSKADGTFDGSFLRDLYAELRDRLGMDKNGNIKNSGAKKPPRRVTQEPLVEVQTGFDYRFDGEDF